MAEQKPTVDDPQPDLTADIVRFHFRDPADIKEGDQ